MRTSYRNGALLLTLLLCPILSACSSLGQGASGSESSQTATQQSAAQADPPVVAEVDGRKITLAQLNDWIKEDFIRELEETRSPSELYELRSASLVHLITEDLLEEEAQKQGMSTEELLATNTGALEPIGEDEARRFFAENASRIRATRYEEVSEDIKAFLREQRVSEQRERYFADLRRNAQVTILIEPPRVEVAATGPSIGPDDAAVTIIEFSDYQCPFCRQAEPSLWEIMDRFPTQVRWVFRHFPLVGIHPDAMSAAEATVCADKQGMFWEMHRVIFNNTHRLNLAALAEYAEEVRLDSEAFARCMDEGGGAAVVEADIREAEAAGVTGTPAFFINGIAYSGAMPVEELEAIILRELAQLEAERED